MQTRWNLWDAYHKIEAESKLQIFFSYFQCQLAFAVLGALCGLKKSASLCTYLTFFFPAPDMQDRDFFIKNHKLAQRGKNITKWKKPVSAVPSQTSSMGSLNLNRDKWEIRCGYMASYYFFFSHSLSTDVQNVNATALKSQAKSRSCLHIFH